MELKRVVVTGLGAITPLGMDVETTWDNAIKGVSGAGPITHFDTTLFKTKFACEVKGFDAANYVSDPNDRRELKDFKRTDLYTQYALAAAKQAVEDASCLPRASTATRLASSSRRASVACTPLRNRLAIMPSTRIVVPCTVRSLSRP